MHYPIISRRDGSFYVSECGFDSATDALLYAEQKLIVPREDLGVLGTIYVTSLHSQHPCPTAIPSGFYKEFTQKGK